MKTNTTSVPKDPSRTDLSGSLIMLRIALFVSASLLALAVFFAIPDSNTAADQKTIELLNVSYDPTRELYRDLNELFRARYEKDRGVKLNIKQSHAGSVSPAKSVLDGSQEADVVPLALWSDIDALRQKGLVAPGWQQRLAHNSLPYYST